MPGLLHSADPPDAARTDELREANTALLFAAFDADEHSESAERARVQLQLLLEGLSEGVIVLDGDGAIRFMNKAASTITGLTRNTLDPGHGLQHHQLQRADGTPLDVAEWPISRALRGDRFVDEELGVVVSGGLRHVVFSGNCVTGAGGAVQVAIVTCRDITEFRQLQQLREEDTALISHDLRNPLTIIMSAASQLRGPGDPEDFAGLILSNARRMRQIVDELVESAYLESGNATIHHEPVSMVPLVTGCVRQLGEPQRIRVSIVGTQTVVDGDRARIERLVTNLVGNALKYSAAGTSVEVSIDSRVDEVVVSVRDEGKGIPPTELEHIFERFYRVQQSSGIKGSGLGLYIARLVTEAHGGWIEATSEVGSGSTFSFGLPTLANGSADA